MNFNKRISHLLVYAVGTDARKLRWIAVCALLAAAVGPAQFKQTWQPRPRRAQAEQATALQGEAAIRQLKTDGGYTSLAAAMAAARYQINAAPAQSALFGRPGQSGSAFYANNPGQQLRATFRADEVRVNAASNKSEGETEGAELRLQLAGFGYGEQLEPLTKGVLTAHDDRLEIKKSAISNQPGSKSTITEWYMTRLYPILIFEKEPAGRVCFGRTFHRSSICKHCLPNCWG